MGEAQELTGEVFAFIERYSAWTGRAWLEVRGRPRRRIRIGTGYGPRRRALRERFPDRPFVSEWSSGAFPPAPLGLPARPVLVGAFALGAAVCTAGALVAGPWGAGLTLVAVAWPLLRLLDAAWLLPEGLRLGPVWAPVTPWHEVVEVGVHRGRVWARTRRGGGSAPVPAVLVPAVRARLHRLAALPLVEAPPGTDARYALWQQVAAGVPWGLFAGTIGAMWLTADPWSTLALGLVLVAGTALLAAAVQARASGWGVGGVAWLTVLHALLLAILALGTVLVPRLSEPGAPGERPAAAPAPDLAPLRPPSSGTP